MTLTFNIWASGSNKSVLHTRGCKCCGLWPEGLHPCSLPSSPWQCFRSRLGGLSTIMFLQKVLWLGSLVLLTDRTWLVTSDCWQKLRLPPEDKKWPPLRLRTKLGHCLVFVRWTKMPAQRERCKSAYSEARLGRHFKRPWTLSNIKFRNRWYHFMVPCWKICLVDCMSQEMGWSIPTFQRWMLIYPKC